MRNVMRSGVVCATLAIVVAPVQVRADGYFAPWIAANVASATDAGTRAFGATTGYMGAGVFGFEADFGYSPNFLGSNFEFQKTTAITIMTNAILGIPIGGTHGAGVRPFVSGGLGLIRSQQNNVGDFSSFSQIRNDVGYELGAGMMGFFNQHVGLRGDARYLRTLQDVNVGSGINFNPGLLRYWRVSGGLTFR
jgi:hypothetical protein